MSPLTHEQEILGYGDARIAELTAGGALR